MFGLKVTSDWMDGILKVGALHWSFLPFKGEFFPFKCCYMLRYEGFAGMELGLGIVSRIDYHDLTD